MTKNQLPKPQRIANELEEVYKQMADLHDKVKDLQSKGFGPLSSEMQQAKVTFEELQRRKIFLLKESFIETGKSAINYDAGLE
jgi:hypothetical protein